MLERHRAPPAGRERSSGIFSRRKCGLAGEEVVLPRLFTDLQHCRHSFRWAWHWAHIGSPVPLGVDFRGGTQVQVQFDQTPDIDAIRQATRSRRHQGRQHRRTTAVPSQQRGAHQPARAAQRELARCGPAADCRRAATRTISNPFTGAERAGGRPHGGQAA